MPKNCFICPDGQTLDISQCLSGICRMGQRCAPYAYLQMSAEERKWNNVPSTTQLINGTRMEFFKLTRPYNISPADATYRIIGTKGHQKLQNYENDFSFLEEKLSDEKMTGTLDSLEYQVNIKRWWVIDYKTIGSYKVAKVLGIQKVGLDKPILDEKGRPVLFKTGARAGQPKTQKVYQYNKVEADDFEYALQLNRYRIFAEKALSEEIDKMMLFIIPRDGGTHVATSRGVEKMYYYVPVRKIADTDVEGYFQEKTARLLESVNSGKIPPICSPIECWDGRRCADYCEVKEYCRQVGDNHYLLMHLEMQEIMNDGNI